MFKDELKFNEMTANKRFDPDEIRKDFPLLANAPPTTDKHGNIKPFVYLDNGATTQKPQQVIDAIVNYYQNQNANVHRGIYKLSETATAAYEESRKKVARFINARSSREIIFTRGTTEAINLVASAWGRKNLQPDDEILVSEMEHHSNLIPWQMLAREKQARLKFIPITEHGTLDLSDIKSLLTNKIRLVALTHMSNVFGTINPVRELIRKAHARCIPVLLDGAQSVPHLPIDVQELDCDFLAFSAHKMCGSTGIGVLYGKENLLEEMDPYQGGGDMISSVWLERATWNELPYKFEAGTPNIAGAIGLGAAVDYLSQLTMPQITLYEQKITSYAMLQLGKIDGLHIYGQAPERGGVISFNLASIHPHDLAQFLDNENIAVRAGHHCAQPVMRKLKIAATTRASLYFYTTYEEVDLLVKSLKKAKEFFL